MSSTKMAPLAGCSDCNICWKSVAQIQNETAKDYINKTVAVCETTEQTKARKKAFLDEMVSGKFLLMPGGVSQTAACDV